MTAQKKYIDRLLDMTYEEVDKLISTLTALKDYHGVSEVEIKDELFELERILDRTNRDCQNKNLKYKKETQY
mgnify:CR=1 FL=1|tara:strand:+ start:457 stop:672 length:216 start_codon:yes stop_codon:yes gene_type:complete